MIVFARVNSCEIQFHHITYIPWLGPCPSFRALSLFLAPPPLAVTGICLVFLSVSADGAILGVAVVGSTSSELDSLPLSESLFDEELLESSLLVDESPSESLVLEEEFAVDDSVVVVVVVVVVLS